MRLTAGIGVVLALAACGSSSGISLNAPFYASGQVQGQTSCDGGDHFPTISWSGLPKETKSLAIEIIDTNQMVQGSPFTHWVAFIDPTSGHLPSSVTADTAAAWTVGLNGYRVVGYTGPCPPFGTTHTYTLKLMALDKLLAVSDGGTLQVGFSAELTAKYSRKAG